MEVFNTKNKIIITCMKRLAPYLHAEIQELGFEIKEAFATGAELYGTVNDCIRLNLNLRCASQVLYSLKSFDAENPHVLYEEINRMPWEDIIPFDGYLSVTSNVMNAHITTPLFANLKVKDAIVDRIKTVKGIRPNSGSELNKAVFHLYWKENRADLYFDTSGETLAKHGYRKIPGKAPMLEALAAGVIMATKWDKKSPFINPMCGSGTLAIEAALIATNRRPGLFRMNYSFMHIIGYNEEVFYEERRRLKAQIIKNVPLKIVASDRSQEAMDITLVNAKTAGVDQLISFQTCDFADSEVPTEAGGVVVINPEYGERLGVHARLEETYARIGDFFKKKCQSYHGYVFTGNPDLAKKIGLKADRRIEFYNGKLDCRLLEYQIYSGTKRTPE